MNFEQEIRDFEQILKWFLMNEPWDKETIQELEWAIQDCKMLMGA